jgi:AcrR family transcriptional regulator
MPQISTRVSILDSSTEIFARKGFNRSTMRDIAELAGVNNVTIYRHAFDKQSLYKLALEHEADRVHLWKAVEAVQPLLDAGRPETIALLLELLIEIVTTSQLSGMISSAFEGGTDPELRGHVEKTFLEPLFDIVDGFLESAALAGSLSNAPGHALRDPLFGRLLFTLSSRTHLQKSLTGRTAAALAEEIVLAWLDGVRGTKPAAER